MKYVFMAIVLALGLAACQTGSGSCPTGVLGCGPINGESAGATE